MKGCGAGSDWSCRFQYGHQPHGHGVASTLAAVRRMAMLRVASTALPAITRCDQGEPPNLVDAHVRLFAGSSAWRARR